MDAKSIFQRRFHGRRRCRIVRSLLDCLADESQPRLVTSPKQRQEPCSGPPNGLDQLSKMCFEFFFQTDWQICNSPFAHLPWYTSFASQEKLKAMLTQNFGWLTRCIVGNVQMANGVFNRPFVARTQLLVDRWGPEQRFQQVSLMDLTRAWV